MKIDTAVIFLIILVILQSLYLSYLNGKMNALVMEVANINNRQRLYDAYMYYYFKDKETDENRLGEHIK